MKANPALLAFIVLLVVHTGVSLAARRFLSSTKRTTFRSIRR